jgi:murein DD-endopeptidase MepM/ murein hydrolase activator NlpD
MDVRRVAQRVGGWAVAVTAGLAVACGQDGAAPTPVPSPQPCLPRATFGAPDQSAYVLPYPVGASYSVLQTYCGPYSHSEQLAYDFLTPEGSTVTAARGGVVVAVLDRWPDSDWASDHFNYVYIRHEDGSAAFYAHLQLGSLAVRLNDRVETGQRIGSSGHSGTPVADLHFGVYRTWPMQHGDDLPVNFRNAAGPLDSRGGLQAGVIYLALPY